VAWPFSLPSCICTLENSTFLDLDQRWQRLLDSGRPLVIASVHTRDLGGSPFFYFRDRIIRRLAPPQVNLLSLEFDCEWQDALAKSSFSSDGSLTIHGVMLNQLQLYLPINSLCLLIDLDAFPLSERSIWLTFVLADQYGISGNAQRTNCISNGEHLFIGPSYLCFSQMLLNRRVGNPWVVNQRSDVGEEICWSLSIQPDENFFLPKSTLFPPLWPLEGDRKVYGIGTVFSCGEESVSYHHFFARNVVSRVHFALVSLFHYFLILFVSRSSSPKSGFSLVKCLAYVKRELGFATRYFKGNPF